LAKVGALEFFKQVRHEALKVTWSSRRETIVTTGVVLVLILISSVFFLIVDSVIFNSTQAIMGF
jgi:preprotein translocase subunit SecE